MNRRDVLKLGVAALASSRCGGSSSPSSSTSNREAAGGQPAAAQNSGTVKIALHGPAIMFFSADGKLVDIDFLAFQYDPSCAGSPVHMPIVKVREGTCLTTGKEEFVVAGLRLAPAFGSGALAAAGFNSDPNNNEYPQNGRWDDLKWIPRFSGVVSEERRRALTIASVHFDYGTLVALPPEYEAARKTYYSALTPKDYGTHENAGTLGTVTRFAMTDGLLFTAPFNGATVKLRATWLASDPAQGFDVEFKPAVDTGNVTVVIDSDVWGGTHIEGDTPVELYCGFHQIAKPAPPRNNRVMPYKNGTFVATPEAQKAEEAAFPHGDHRSTLFTPDDGVANRRPPPLCGMLRVVRA